MKLIIHFATLAILALSSCNSETRNEASAQTSIVQGRDTTITFNGSEPGKLPATWSQETSTWFIAMDGNNPALKMQKDGNNPFNIAVLKDVYYKNLTMDVRVKAIAGFEDRGGGLVWRYIDRNNYYIVRANPLENNIRLYKVVNGQRLQMKSEGVTMKSGEWFTIKVIANENKMECFYNGAKVFEATDDTFSNAGLVGFWSKADAASLFDDLRITTSTSPMKKIVFVCQHGAAKSVVAATWFNKLAQERNLNFEGVCRGVDPDSVVSAGTAEGLKQDNLFDAGLKPKKIAFTDTVGVERIILFDALPADFKSNLPVEDWSAVNSLGTDYGKRKEAIIKKLDILLDSLEKQK